MRDYATDSKGKGSSEATQPPPPQVRQAYRVIGPAEYNRAVRRSPRCCPLPITGDHRSGQRLLVDAAADFALTVAALARSAPGRAALSPVLAHLKDLLDRIERGTAPAPLEARRRRRPPPSKVAAAALPGPAPQHVHRPLQLARDAVLLSENPLRAAIAGHGLDGAQTAWMINLGSDARRQAAIASTLPRRLLGAAARLVVAIQRSGPAPPLVACGDAGGDGGGNLPAADGGGDSGEGVLGGSPGGWSAEEEAMWEAEAEVGVLLVQFDPATQRRRRLAINGRFAAMWGQHREECQVPAGPQAIAGRQ